jgi:hypothetical protein
MTRYRGHTRRSPGTILNHAGRRVCETLNMAHDVAHAVARARDERPGSGLVTNE